MLGLLVKGFGMGTVQRSLAVWLALLLRANSGLLVVRQTDSHSLVSTCDTSHPMLQHMINVLLLPNRAGFGLLLGYAHVSHHTKIVL